ncbi:hypothetical protein [Parvicella tangerina]|nr:hypothetical protein [Parvicella tangerina]
MNVIFYFITTSVVLFSCTLNKVNETTPSEKTVDPPSEPVEIFNKDYNVQIKITEYIPYCGGAAPGPDQLNNSVSYTGKLIVTNLSDDTQTELLPNAGVYQIQLRPGAYTIKEAYKNLPFTEFMAQNQRSGMYYMDGTEECYKKWWQSNLFEFEVTDIDTLINLETSIGSSCFTGTNPCLQYTGPYPP